MTTFRYIAYDHMGVKRVYGDGPTKDIAESRCLLELEEYQQRRPDLRPFEVRES